MNVVKATQQDVGEWLNLTLALWADTPATEMQDVLADVLQAFHMKLGFQEVERVRFH